MAFSAALAAIMVGVSLGISAALAHLFPAICWTPRIGGTLVGAAVFLQGYIFANPGKFSRVLRSGITFEQRLMHVVFTASVFGTLLWAFGDLIPTIFSVANCRA